MPFLLIQRGGERGEKGKGREVYSLPCLETVGQQPYMARRGHLIIAHASLSRRRTAPTRDTSNFWGLNAFYQQNEQVLMPEGGIKRST